MEGLTSSSNSEVLLRYRNRSLRETDLQVIRSLIFQSPALTRNQMARRLCELWDWRQPNGYFRLYACADLLRRLHQWGHIQLPPSRKSANPRTTFPLLPLKEIPLAWIEVEDPHADLDSLVVRPIAPEERFGWRVFMEQYHYLGARTIIGEHLLYAAFLQGELVALLGWAAAALHAPLRERFVGWDEETKRKRLHLITNNIRFLIPPWVKVRHLASKVLAANLRRLASDWNQAWGHPVYLAETFVDRSRFRGTCYKASNWICLGETAGRSKKGNAYATHGIPKSLYIYELHSKARRLLRGEERA